MKKLRSLLLPALLALASLLPSAFAADPTPANEAWKIGWPSLTGPTGNLLPLRSSTPLIDDLSQARLLWVTTNRELGSAKTGSQTWVNSARVEGFIGPDAKTYKGNWAGVVVADGRVFGNSWVPSGRVFTAPYKTNKPYEKGETEKVPTRFHVEADDVVLCFDANDGKLLWKTSEPGGLIRAGGKRGGFQVAMAVADNRAFALGSTGRLFAYDATTGKKLWQSDIGPAHKSALAELKESLATAEAGTVVIPDAPGWFNSLVVADGILVTGDFQGSSDLGLRGYDAATGELKWTAPKVISKYATPSPWKHAGKTWLLVANDSGTMQLLDPLTGKPAWKVTGLGKNWPTLTPGENTVMVNVKPGAPKEKRSPGLWGAYRISPEKAELAWQLPDEPRNQISTWMDNGARHHAFIRDGRVLLHTDGTKEAPGRALLLNEKDGTILAETPSTGSSIEELILWTGDRAYVRSDHSHGANHGGRHPLLTWRTEPNRLEPIIDEGRLGGLDLVDFDTAYEVLMYVPLVDGRMFERTDDGRIACYDLRQVPGLLDWSIQLEGANLGMQKSVPLHLYANDKQVSGGKDWIADSTESALPAGTVRRRFLWETAGVQNLKTTGTQISGPVLLNFGTHRWPVDLQLTRNGDAITGTWSRKIPAASEKTKTEGTLLGQANAIRGFPTPWLKDQPWTPFGKNEPGTRTLVFGLDKAISARNALRGLTLSFDHDGKTFTRAAGIATQFSQAWHEVDASNLTLKDNRITGKAVVILNLDPYLTEGLPPGTPHGIAGVISLDATIDADNKITGTYTATWGQPYETSGKATGTIQK